MWTTYFIASLFGFVGSAALAHASALFERRDSFKTSLMVAGLFIVAAGVTGWRAFW